MTIDDLYQQFDPQPWAKHAACKGLTDLFFPEKGSSLATEQAVAVCRTCPVRTECLEYALDNAVRHGVFGGTSEHERRELRRQRRAEMGYGAHGPMPRREAS